LISRPIKFLEIKGVTMAELVTRRLDLRVKSGMELKNGYAIKLANSISAILDNYMF
jgi:hypothetical protein